MKKNLRNQIKDIAIDRVKEYSSKKTMDTLNSICNNLDDPLSIHHANSKYLRENCFDEDGNFSDFGVDLLCTSHDLFVNMTNLANEFGLKYYDN